MGAINILKISTRRAEWGSPGKTGSYTFRDGEGADFSTQDYKEIERHRRQRWRIKICPASPVRQS